jgi:hypothetical protein
MRTKLFSRSRASAAAGGEEGASARRGAAQLEHGAVDCQIGYVSEGTRRIQLAHRQDPGPGVAPQQGFPTFMAETNTFASVRTTFKTPLIQPTAPPARPSSGAMKLP